MEGCALRAELAGLGFKRNRSVCGWREDCKEAKTEARTLIWRLSKKSRRKVMVLD